MTCPDAFHFNPDWLLVGMCVVLGTAAVVALIGLVRSLW
jgi:hypothetical protein